MKAIVVGAGEIGRHLAKVLASEGRDTVLIDQSEGVRQHVQESADIMTLQGSGTSSMLLKEAGISDADLFIAVTDSDKVNIIACAIANQNGAKTKVARVSSTEYFNNEEILKPSDFGIDILINPEKLSANEFVRLLSFPDTREFVEFENGKIQLVAFNVDSNNPLVGKSMGNLVGYSWASKLRFTAIKRPDGETVIPTGRDSIQKADEVFVIGSREAINEMLDFCNVAYRVKPHRVIVVGANRVGIYIAQSLEINGINTKLVDKNLDKAETASGILGKSTVLCGDYLDPLFLDEIGVKDVDGFISVTGHDEDDIMACVTAKQNGAKYVSALIQQPRYLPILADIPLLDAVVSRHLVAVSEILHLVRRGHIISAASLHEIEAEVLEMIVDPGTKIAGKTVSSIRFPDHALIAAIVRRGIHTVATGDLTILPGDHVIVFSLPDAISKVEELFLAK
jgi:trk system potassium uptake protein TrkA